MLLVLAATGLLGGCARHLLLLLGVGSARQRAAAVSN